MHYIKFAKTCAAVGKSIKEDYLQKCLPIFIFISNLSLLIVKILRGYNQETR